MDRIIFSDLIDDDYIKHYGTPKHSGRYPWGSGDNPYQHGSADFLSRVDRYKKQGQTEKQIAEGMGITTKQLRAWIGICNNQRRIDLVNKCKNLREEGKNLTEIGKIVGKTDTTVASLLNEKSEKRMYEAQIAADEIRKAIDSKGMVDVGSGVNLELGISSTKMEQALEILKSNGYEAYTVGLPQATNPGQQTVLRVICPEGTEYKDVYTKMASGEIRSVTDYISSDDGIKYKRKDDKIFRKPTSIDPSRVKINYAEDGGIKKDGLVEIRPGVKDLSLGNSHYSQVRIKVGDDHYIKGMAVYSDNIPDGYDILFNTNKDKSKSKLEVLKETKADPDNPFGAYIKPSGQSTYFENGVEKLSVINKVRDEGEVGKWKKELSSQFLSKQNTGLMKKQLNLAYSDSLSEYETICNLTNPTIKKYYLDKFAGRCDSSAVNLEAAALPRTKHQVIMPIPSLKNDEVYAPNYENGEKLALIRFPHGGTFEIPILKVNNKNAEAKKYLGNAQDAVGINNIVADRLSGADFDGDTVLTIPLSRKVKITSTPELDELKGFDPKEQYPYRDGIKVITEKNEQKEMGVISNLITDMTLKGAHEDEIAKAVKHSMVVIDSRKHKLDYKRSEQENSIQALKKKYQKHINDDGYGGSSTIISKAKSDKSVVKRKGAPYVNIKGAYMYDPSRPEGALIYKDDPKAKYSYTNKKGEEVVKYRTQRSTAMAETDDAYSLVSGVSVVEDIYADYANKMKALANSSRKESYFTKGLTYSASARKTYSKEVASLYSKLNESLKNSPRERQANVIANGTVNAKLEAYGGNMPKAEIKKIKQQAIDTARANVGSSSKDRKIVITDKEWEAIQAGAISSTNLLQILNYTDADDLRERSMPMKTKELSNSKIASIKAMSLSGYTNAEIAARFGVSASTITKYLKGSEH